MDDSWDIRTSASPHQGGRLAVYANDRDRVRFVPDAISDQYLEGHDACLKWIREGGDTPQCPYRAATYESVQWVYGFMDCEEAVKARLQRKAG